MVNNSFNDYVDIGFFLSGYLHNKKSKKRCVWHLWSISHMSKIEKKKTSLSLSYVHIDMRESFFFSFQTHWSTQWPLSAFLYNWVFQLERSASSFQQISFLIQRMSCCPPAHLIFYLRCPQFLNPTGPCLSHSKSLTCIDLIACESSE